MSRSNLRDSVSNWPVTTEDLVYDGFRKVIRRTFKTHNGLADFDIIHGHDSCCILAITDNNKIVLARQFRPGPNLVLNELPGGGIEANEDPMRAAERELIEETGYQGDLEFIARTPIDAYSTSFRYHFVAKNCTSAAQIKNDTHELTQPVLMELDEFRKHLINGQLTDIATGYMGLEALGLLT